MLHLAFCTGIGIGTLQISPVFEALPWKGGKSGRRNRTKEVESSFAVVLFVCICCIAMLRKGDKHCAAEKRG